MDKTNDSDKKEQEKNIKTDVKDGEAQLEKRVEELEDQLKRAIADYRNLERRVSEERSNDIKFANRQLIVSLLPAIDILVLADKFTNDENVKLAVTKILEILKDNGIEKIDTNDAKYNAELMEAVQLEGEAGDQVIEELRSGFTLYGKVIRPAQVKVGNKS